MRLIQFLQDGRLTVGRVVDDQTVEGLDAPGAGVYALAQTAIHDGISLAEAALRCQVIGRLRYQALIDERRLLAPLTHPEPSRMLVSGTGLTHLGSAASRDAMHSKLQADAQMTDSMKMFKAGLEGGSPRPGEIGFQPEWFYKGDGSIVVAPEQPIPVPAFAQDAGEEPELVALYVIGFDGTPHRAGFAVGNEFSDHVTERFNYLWLAHSKLRSCSYGPELLVGDLPADLQGTSRVLRDGATLWEKPFLTGEANMCHTIANLEHHHFKYAQFRRPGDVHVHFFGTATLSFADGIRTRSEDVFEITQPALGRPLRNPLMFEAAAQVPVQVSPL